ncbi:hypothetical protein AL036_01365 [Salipiger aestuarii]|uniref:CDP-alcohol phosphatidyltransferase-like enzyme n=1 Tax=Salipiger aestuarii TaxID=568098 RepID=A0A327Z181_9RHOB|nr:CDP-alcohol phosphatidyltransferase family protein [Salipiger aestuarii]EIE49556.1 CDP-alcohol phosphatidyltransferase [Citreicella sp. 357]KAA8610143.1 hypothetical protein AL036_01365 [Salipiger aestuarii]KAB2543342.1 hypothetical protein AL035_02480 [Salipiger aestuarii]RAK23989.1 CDP-alcohol phosphatidyltransferase-like enzyme [Salipiger aestuarii]
MHSAEPPSRRPGPALLFGASAGGLAVAVTLASRALADGAAALAPVLGFVLASGIAAVAFLQGWKAARVGPANAVTLGRLALVSLFLAPLADPGLTQGATGWGLFALALLALALDGVDGSLARRSGLAGPWGARFDMEVDALFGLILAALAWRSGAAGAWVLSLGAMRYLFVLSGRVWPRLTAPLPDSLRRKTVCVVQIGTLAALVAPVAVPPGSQYAALAALGLLTWSFAVDIRWLMRRR